MIKETGVNLSPLENENSGKSNRAFYSIKKIGSHLVNEMKLLCGLAPDQTVSVDANGQRDFENAVSDASLSDLTKLTYKEIYAYYRYVEKDENIVGNWRKNTSVDQIKSGLDARVFVNDKLKEINIAFEGSHGFTKLLGENIVDSALFKDLYRHSAGFTKFLSDEAYQKLYRKWHLILGKDGVSDLQLMANRVPDQFYNAYDWFGKTVDAIKKDPALSGYQVVVTGHSLAGALAQLVSAKYYLDTGETIPTMAIQGPGMLTQLEQLAGRRLEAKDFSYIVNFCMEGDPVGEFMQQNHIGLTVPLPYDLARGDRPGDLPNYRIGMEVYQAITGIKNVRLDRHEIGQQIHIFDGTRFSYPENRVLLGEEQTVFHSVSKVEELIVGNDLGNEIHANDEISYIVGGKGNDFLYGGQTDTFLAGGAGNDFIYGGAGNDLLYGGDGNDTLEGGTGNDALYGGQGNDTLIWSGGNDFLYGQGGENQYILGKKQNGELTRGIVTLKFDRENIENSHVRIQTSEIDTDNSEIIFMMSDQILPTHMLVTEKEQGLYVQYGDHSSFQIDQWSTLKDGIGAHITFEFMGSEHMQYTIAGNLLAKK